MNMHTLIGAIGAVLAAAVLAGCGGGGGVTDTQAGVEQDDFKAIVITYDGHTLHCIERPGTTHGHYSGLTCDFGRWHREAGR